MYTTQENSYKRKGSAGFGIGQYFGMPKGSNTIIRQISTQITLSPYQQTKLLSIIDMIHDLGAGKVKNQTEKTKLKRRLNYEYTQFLNSLPSEEIKDNVKGLINTYMLQRTFNPSNIFNSQGTIVATANVRRRVLPPLPNSSQAYPLARIYTPPMNTKPLLTADIVKDQILMALTNSANMIEDPIVYGNAIKEVLRPHYSFGEDIDTVIQEGIRLSGKYNPEQTGFGKKRKTTKKKKSTKKKSTRK